MKKFQLIILGIALTAFIAACGGNANNSNQNQEAPTDQTTETQAAEQGPEFTSAYVCPMHCEGSGSDQPGTCPVCGMDYVANENAKTDDHSHDGHNHDGHSH